MALSLYRFVFKAMGCENEIRFYAPSQEAAERAARMAVDEALRIEQKYSRYRADSLVSQINANAGGEPTALDDETLFLLTHAAKCHAISGGLFDITSGVLRRVWNFAGGVPPDPQQVHDILPLIGWDKVELDGRKIRLAKVGMEIDFGGIGKEYAVDRLAGILASAGVKSGIVNLGGDIRVIGPHLAVAHFNIGNAVGNLSGSWRYSGSLTAPAAFAPTCEEPEGSVAHQLETETLPENVSWVVLSHTLTLAPAQIAAFHTLFPESNAREVMPLKGRKVTVYK